MLKPTDVKDYEHLFKQELERRKDSIRQLVRFIFKHQGRATEKDGTTGTC